MRKITIERFGPIKKIDVSLDKNLSVIIGQQASGKSTFAKTVYFCRSIIISLISKNEDKNKIFDIIDRIFKSESFILASDYFKSYTEREKVWDELNKLATVRDKQEFYNLCESGVVNNNENFLKKIIKTVTVRK